jgi:hypothetical protein
MQQKLCDRLLLTVILGAGQPGGSSGRSPALGARPPRDPGGVGKARPPRRADHCGPACTTIRVPFNLTRQVYGIALPGGSEIREPVNIALLGIIGSGDGLAILDDYPGPEH